MASGNLTDEIIPDQQDIFICISHLLSYIEFLPLLALLAMSAINTWLVLISSVLHTNLKAILLGQSLVILVYAVNRIFQLWWQYTHNWQYYDGGWTVSIQLACITFGNLIGHVLLIERAMATLNSRNYENQKNHWFTFGWISCMIAMIVLSQFVSFSYSQISYIPVIIWSHLALVFSGIELFAFAWLNIHNRNQFNMFSNIRANLTHRYQLSERYQLLQNIHSGRQLGPSFVFHLFNILCSNVVCAMGIYLQIQNFQIIQLTMSIIFLIHAFSKLGIEITVITFHPLLNQKLRLLLSGIHWRKSRISTNNANGRGDRSAGHKIFNHVGNDNNGTEEYFKMLRHFWE